MIDTQLFEPSNSRWGDIQLQLESWFKERKLNVKVYPPGMKTGDCTEPYIVVKNDGSYKHANFSTNRDMYAIMCYVPKQQYSKLEPLVQKVKEAMKPLVPMIVPYGQETPSYYDDTCKAHYISVEYENYKKC